MDLREPMTRFAALMSALFLVAACAGDPLQDVPRLSDADVSDTEIQAAIRGEPLTDQEPIAPQRGVLGRLFGNRAAAPAADGLRDTDSVAETETGVAISQETSDPPAQGGLLGFLRRAADDARSDEAEGTVDVAALPQNSRTDDSSRSRGIFGRSQGPEPGDPDYRVVPLGTTLPYGELARVCDVRNRQLGSRVERYPEGRGMYALYDSNPGDTGLHTFYVTGFKDGCARQFTAALAVFGSTEVHERLRYGLPAEVQPYSETDAAYEQLKSRVCRVGRGRPCGSALPRLARNTVFVSVYERFGSNPAWKTILIHDGEVVETDIRTN